MFAAARSVTRAAPQIRNAILAKNMTTISGPPQTRVSFAEKIAHGVVMTVAYLTVPAWVLYHVREYRGKED